MHDRKTIRRRRAVLGLLVAVSVILLTASFGDGAGSVERGALQVFGPVQEGASRILKPVRDAAGWVGDTLHAKGDVAQLRAERDQLRGQVSEAQTALRDNARLRALLAMDQRLSLGQRDPLTARVITRPASVWSSTIALDKGSGDGVRAGLPVVAEGGLIGRVTAVTGGNAEVMLITNADSAVAARGDQSGVAGIVEPEVGDPNDLRLQYVARVQDLREGEGVTTTGSLDPRFPLPFPAGLPIGRITQIDDDEHVHVRPFADVRRLDYVQVLRRTGGG